VSEIDTLLDRCGVIGFAEAQYRVSWPRGKSSQGGFHRGEESGRVRTIYVEHHLAAATP
jgi:hypothetical protein